MNHYNLAVTVGPNIFRSKDITPQDLLNAGTYYDVMIKMMQHFDYIFEDQEDEKQTNNFFNDLESLGAQDNPKLKGRHIGAKGA